MSTRAEVRSHRKLNKWFTPTHLDLAFPDDPDRRTSWTSRRARKGRYQPKAHLVRSKTTSSDYAGDAEAAASSAEQEVMFRVKAIEGDIKPHLMLDISFWVAVAFTFGSAVWVVNGFLVWFPVLRPYLASTTFENTAAALAFLGGTVFEIGSYLMVVEALDRGRETSFGTALGQLLHYHRHLGRGSAGAASLPSGAREKTSSSAESKRSSSAKRFIWWGKPMWHDLGYVAALVQLFGATVFWVATVTGLPGVIPGLYEGTSSVAITDIFYWSAQVVGGSGFIISSFLLMLEVQRKWWIPALTDLGWWIGFWNLVGAFGFTLCGALGYAENVSSGAEYESGLATWWGSWAFLIGSILQLWETFWREVPQASSSKDQ